MSSMTFPMQTPPKPVDLPPRLVALVVDDDPNSLVMVSDALEAMGITVMTARDGHAALRFAQKLPPDVVLLDAVMPGLDGFETCRRLKSAPLSLNAPVIFMTGLSATENLIEGLRAGGVDYVTKPLDLEALSARITVHLLNSLQLSSARQALDANGRPVAAFIDGQIAWCSPRARDLFEAAPEMFSEGSARESLLAWLQELHDTPLSHAVDFEHQPLILTYLGTSAATEILVSVHSTTTRGREVALRERFSLTEREADVLLWVTRGKTNADIGQILDLSRRTVDKHLEQVFQKMGVENRTTAAVMADRALFSI